MPIRHGLSSFSLPRQGFGFAVRIAAHGLPDIPFAVGLILAATPLA